MIRVAALALLVTSLLWSTRAHAEANPDTMAPPKLDLRALDKSYRSALARRNVGIGLAIPGVSLNLVGTVLLGYGLADPNLVSQGLETFGGILVAAIGLGLAVPGVVLWILGQDTMDVITWRRRQLSTSQLRPLLAPTRDGAWCGFALSF